jgi:hypothetical protein
LQQNFLCPPSAIISSFLPQRINPTNHPTASRWWKSLSLVRTRLCSQPT